MLYKAAALHTVAHRGLAAPDIAHSDRKKGRLGFFHRTCLTVRVQRMDDPIGWIFADGVDRTVRDGGISVS